MQALQLLISWNCKKNMAHTIIIRCLWCWKKDKAYICGMWTENATTIF